MSDLPFRQPKEHSEIPSVGPVSVYHLEAYHHLRRHAAVDYAHPHSVLARRLHKQAQNEVLEGNRGAKNEVRKLTARVENAKRKKDQTRAQDKIDRELLRDTDEPLSETSEEMELPKKPRKAYRERLQDVHPDELELPEPKQLPAGPLILLCVVSVSCSSIDFPPSVRLPSCVSISLMLRPGSAQDHPHARKRLLHGRRTIQTRRPTKQEEQSAQESIRRF